MSQDLWKGFKKRNPYAVSSSSTTENFEKDRLEKYGILARVSSEMQFEDGESFELQITKGKRLIEERNNGVLIDIFKEEGKSAFNTRGRNKKNYTNRSEFMRLLQAVKEGKINHILCFTRSRISRLKDERNEIFRILREHGCKVTLTSTEEEIDIALKDRTSALIEDIKGFTDESYSQDVSINVTDTMWELAAHQGRIMGGQPPIGYKGVYKENSVDQDSKKVLHFEPIAEFQETKEYIEELYLQGIGLKSIARHLNGGKVKGLTPLLKPAEKPVLNSKVSNTWNEKNIETVLFNPVYTGYISYQSYRHEDTYKPIVKKSPFVQSCRSEERQKEINDFKEKKVKRIKRGGSKIYQTPFLLRGILICAHCGKPYEVTTSQRKDGTAYSYYRCPNKFNDKAQQCPAATLRKEVIESFIFDNLEKLLKELATTESFRLAEKKLESGNEEAEKQLEDAKLTLMKKNKIISNIIQEKLLLDHDSPTYAIHLELYNKEEQKLVQEISELKTVISDLEYTLGVEENEKNNIEEVIHIISEFHDVFRHTSDTKKRVVLEELLSHITVDKDSQIEIVLSYDIVPAQVDDTIIGHEKIGEGIVSNNITVSLHSEKLSFNYHERVMSVYRTLSTSFYPFLLSNIPSLSKYAQMNAQGVWGATQKLTPSERKTFLQHYSIPLHSFKSIENNFLPKKIFNRIFPNQDSFQQIVNFINTKHFIFNFSLQEFIGISEAADSSSNPYSKLKMPLFKDKIKCRHCNKIYSSKINLQSFLYRCPRNRSDVSNRCYSEKINETVLLNSLKEVLNIDDITIASSKDVEAVKSITLIDDSILLTLKTGEEHFLPTIKEAKKKEPLN